MDALLAAETPKPSSSASSASAAPLPPSAAQLCSSAPWRQQNEQPQVSAADEWQTSEEEYKPLRADPKKFLPAAKIKSAILMQGQPKMRPKPHDTEETKRAVSARSPEDRKRLRADWEDREPKDEKAMPWDMRGPPGPQEGGPETYMRHKYRPNTRRWAKAGGRHREKYQMWRQKANQGLTGTELASFHPMTKDGHWERQANQLGIPSPRASKEL